MLFKRVVQHFAHLIYHAWNLNNAQRNQLRAKLNHAQDCMDSILHETKHAELIPGANEVVEKKG